MTDSGEKVNLRRGTDFLKSLEDGRKVWVDGELVTNPATHPSTRNYAATLASYYDLHFDPALREELTFVDEGGVRRSRMWQLPRNKQELVERREFHATVARNIGAGQFGRMPDTSASALVTLIDDPEPWERNSVGTEGRGLADNIRSYWREARDNDWNSAPIFIDSAPDRSKPEAFRNSSDLRMVASDDHGITVRGVKAVSTGAIFADWCQVGLFFRPGVTSEQCLFFFVKPNAEGLTIVARKGAAPAEESLDVPMAGLGDELDSFQHFDNVKIPWSQVIHLGNIEHTQQYPQRIFDWLHYADLVRQSVKAELMAGLAILLCDVIGTSSIPAVQLRLADIIRFREAVRAHLIAADDTGFTTPGGLYKPNNLMFDFGRAYFNENSPRFVHEILDLSGRGPMMIPSERTWQVPELKEWLEPLMHGPHGENDRLRVFRVVRDLFLTDWGRRNGMFDQFNGTPLTAVRLLTMMRSEFQVDGPLTALAREVCGVSYGGASAGENARDYARAQDAKTT